MFVIGLDLKKKIHSIFGIPYIPEEIYKDKGPLLLHISDTPEESYSFIFKVIEKINPQYIVHTGDIVDNIKLETNKNYLYLYEEALERFIKAIEKHKNITPYYVMGNHDDIDSVKRLSNRGIILEKGVVSIEGLDFCLFHDYEKLDIKTDYCLFGHKFHPSHHIDEGQIVLNGILNINIISLSTGNLYQIDYPSGINYYRKMTRGSIGL